ncbi:tRNA (adenosine(37)-N6)-dimethylallyltransferase MiaA [Leucobacter sp. 1207-22]|uniref:tRNA (adenosine(37)-N6)-dimethylallyltransferase MiaA n=1 Tax=Leucobacter sp. 1207-22 TaxID=2604456 RepID=UPI004062A462
MNEDYALSRRPHVWAVVGATGTGKTALSLDLAARLSAELGVTAEIINVDAMQFYRGMNIGTAKLPESERRGIPHHLFAALDPVEEATVAWYQPTARALIEQIHARGNDAILIGGSGLYVSSVIFDFQFPPRDEVIRARLEAECARDGVAPLLARLAELSPETASAVDAQNPRRVIRALEVAELGGDPQVTLPAEQQYWYEPTRILGVHCERAELVARLDERVEQMWADGLIAEVESLLPLGLEAGPTASRAIGYAQAIAQIRGEKTQEEAIAETQFLTRRYARRQVSWFKRYSDVTWLQPGEPAPL